MSSGKRVARWFDGGHGATRRFRAERWARAGRLAGLLLAAAGGPVGLGACVLGNDTDGPILAVDLLWDRSASNRFAEGTCNEAGVLFLSWRLKDDAGEIVRESEEDATCKRDGPGFNFFGLYLGDYVLEVEGFDEEDVKRWEGRCELSLDRFDRLYRCRVYQEAPDEAAAGDAGPGDQGDGDQGDAGAEE